MNLEFNKLIGILYFIIGMFLLFIYSGIIYISDYFYPSLFFILIGYLTSVKFFNGKSIFYLLISFSLFLSGITLLIESQIGISNYNSFFTASFFLTIILFFLLIFIIKNKNMVYLYIAILLSFVGYYFTFSINPRLLQTFVISVNNLLSFSPFLFLLTGYFLIKE